MFRFEGDDPERATERLGQLLDGTYVSAGISSDGKHGVLSIREKFDSEAFRGRFGGGVVEVLGPDFLSIVSYLVLHTNGRVADHRELLEKLPALKTISINNASRDTDLSTFTWPRIEYVSLTDCDVSGTMLYGLRAANMPAIREIALWDSDFSDTDVDVLFQFTNLAIVHLERTKVSMDGFQRLGNHPSLRRIHWGPEDHRDWTEFLSTHSEQEATELYTKLMLVYVNHPAAREERAIRHKDEIDFYNRHGYFEFKLSDFEIK